uniref:Uncharacterized protein n=1 Tax=Caenorhabditis japonica TaxID=281687 RepID=A0A8R1DS21_CAEJA
MNSPTSPISGTAAVVAAAGNSSGIRGPRTKMFKNSQKRAPRTSFFFRHRRQSTLTRQDLGFSPEATTNESCALWNAVNGYLASAKVLRGGNVPCEVAPLSMYDLVVLMNKVGGIRSKYDVQSWLLSLFLTGTGLRVSSIRNEKSPGNLRDDDDDDDQNDDEAGGGAAAATANGGTDGGDDKSLCVDFDTLTNKNVQIYRRRGRCDDPVGSCRFRVVIKVLATKTTGTELYKPHRLGFSYPQMRNDNTWDWGLSVAVATLSICVLHGFVSLEHVFGDKFEPPHAEDEFKVPMNNETPTRLFVSADSHGNLTTRPMRCVAASLAHSADTLQIPSALFTSRSYRKGFAKSIAQSLVTGHNWKRPVSVQLLKYNLYTSCPLTDGILERQLSVSGGCAIDWMSSLVSTSPWAKKGYGHTTIETSPWAHNKEIVWKKKKELTNALNLHNWRLCPTAAFEEETLAKKMNGKFTLNLQKTLEQLNVENPRGPHSSSKTTFCGMGRLPVVRVVPPSSSPKYICPVVGCANCPQKSVWATNAHWKRCHSRNPGQNHYRVADKYRTF